MTVPAELVISEMVRWLFNSTINSSGELGIVSRNMLIHFRCIFALNRVRAIKMQLGNRKFFPDTLSQTCRF